MPPQLKKRPVDYIPIHERPAFVQEIAASQGQTDEGTRRQDAEVLMDQSGSHISQSDVSSSGRSMRSGMRGTREDARAAAELEAVQNWPCAVESETSSE